MLDKIENITFQIVTFDDDGTVAESGQHIESDYCYIISISPMTSVQAKEIISRLNIRNDTT